MVEIIDLTVSPRPEIIEVSSDQENTPSSSRNRIQENKELKWKKENGPVGDGDLGIGSSAHLSRAHSPDSGNECSDVNDSSACHPESAPQVQRSTLFTASEPGIFCFDGAAGPVALENVVSTPEPAKSSGESNTLLLPSHVAILLHDGPIRPEVTPPQKLNSDDEEYIEYLDYEDRKAPGLVRYFEVQGEEPSKSRSSIFKCKNCGAEGDHRTYACPIQICLTCGARDEHSTRSCPTGKTCYTCGMKGHINKMCPNRFSAYVASSDFYSDCDRCGSTEHKTNECPTLWRIYKYVNDEERVMIVQSREKKRRLAIGEGGEGYIGREVWCYNCASMGHLGDDCDDLPHPVTFPTENSAFCSRNVMSGPFHDPAAELVSLEPEPREHESKVDSLRLSSDWDAGAPADVGKRGKTKNKERLEKRFREQEDEAEDWFDDVRKVKARGMDQQAHLPDLRRKTLRFGSLKDGNYELPPALPTSGHGSSLLARLSNARAGRSRGKSDGGSERHKSSLESETSLCIRGAATNQTDKARYGGSKQGHGPRYRGGYDR